MNLKFLQEDVDDELQVSNIIATTEPIQLQNDEDNFEDVSKQNHENNK